MIKKVLFALVPMVLLAGVVKADDSFMNELASLDAATITDADISIDEASLGGVDVDALANDAGSSDEAVEACFRRFGYRHRSYGYSYGGYNHCYNYNYCYRPVYYSYQCYRPVYRTTYCYRPVHYVSYWGCY